jgi:hypothetical protein
MTAVDEATRSQIDRILKSDVFKSSAGLKRLLGFLADKSLCGEADDLKEYSIGIDAFGKPSTYDPRQDSTVRIQAARLRQKLAEYYRTEGKDDPIVVDLPKGHYKLNWEPRSAAHDAPFESAPSREPRRSVMWLQSALALVSAGLIAVSGWAIHTSMRLSEEQQTATLFHSQWTPELATLWQPFIDSNRPLLISIGTPMFVELPGLGYFRDTSVNSPDAIPQSKTLAAMQQALHVSGLQPMTGYASLGAAQAAFTLGRLLGDRKANVSTINGSELSWRQMSDSNVILIGRPRFFRLQLTGLPVRPELGFDEQVGVRNLHPRAGEPSVFANEHSGSTGTTYAVVSLAPGPEGNTNVIDFFARDGAGMTGAVAWFTDPAFAHNLTAKLRTPSGQIPKYYQVLLKIRYQDRVPLETSYVLHRELRAIGR